MKETPVQYLHGTLEADCTSLDYIETLVSYIKGMKCRLISFGS